MLSFLPSEKGGVFQFPLDKTSPRITRGPGGTTPIPYVTPSLMDLPVLPNDSGGTGYASGYYTPKALSGEIPANGTGTQLAIDYIIFAPWRSLLYRNVDSPFTYSDDLALYPHMPMNTAGFDCRAPRILGDWMVSIPAQRKPGATRYGFRSGGTTVPVNQDGLNIPVDDSPQPYVEVKPGESGYDAALADAEDRLESLPQRSMVQERGYNGLQQLLGTRIVRILPTSWTRRRSAIRPTTRFPATFRRARSRMPARFWSCRPTACPIVPTGS